MLDLLVQSTHSFYFRILLKEKLAELCPFFVILEFDQIDFLMINLANILQIPRKIKKLAIIPSINLPILISFINLMRVLNFGDLEWSEFFPQLGLSLFAEVTIPDLVDDITNLIIIVVVGRICMKVIFIGVWQLIICDKADRVI